MTIHPLAADHRPAIDAYMRALWGGPTMITRGTPYDTSTLPGYVAIEDGALFGFVLYRPAERECEVSALLSLIEHRGVARALLDAVRAHAVQSGHARLWLVTTNDDTRAIRFYQMYGFRLVQVRLGALREVFARKGIPSCAGNDGIPVEHEFEFEMAL